MTRPTTEAGAWPDMTRPGYPLHPERDGWHRVEAEEGGPQVAHWFVNDSVEGPVWAWEHMNGYTPAADAELLGWRYLGPALLPASVAAQRHEQADEFADFLAGITPEERATLAGLRSGELVAVPKPVDWDMGAGRHPFSAVTLHYDDDAKVAAAANAINDALAAAPAPKGGDHG